MNEAPKTYDEFMALPIGGGFGMRTENGVSIPVPPDVVAYHVEAGTLTAVIEQAADEDIRWVLGRYRDGTWFRREA